MSNTVLQMLKASPGAPFADDRLLAECIVACLESAQSCVSCADACLGEEHVDPLRRCVRFALDCADVCEAAARMLSRPHEPDLEVLGRLLHVVVLACRACADECGRHASRLEHCRVCQEICRRCGEAASRLREALERLPAGAVTRH
jgi:hypothetical protein